MKKNKKFISIIWWYHKQIFSFDAKQNYHMHPIEAMKEEWFDCEIFAIDNQVKIEDDPNFIAGTKVIYYKNIFQYFWYLWKNRKEIIYSNSLTIKTLIVGIIWKKTVFMPHDQALPWKDKKIKRYIVEFLYKFFSIIRVINRQEEEILAEKNIAWKVVPLSLSKKFLYTWNKELNNLVFVGNLISDKNPEILIEAMKQVFHKYPHTILNIYGEDRYNFWWKNFNDLIQSNHLDKNIILHGFVSAEKLQKNIQKSYIYINTSLSEWQCLAVYEWALAWCILCLQNIISFPSVFWKNALYHNNADELAKNIIYIIENPDKYQEIVKKNQKMILEKYNYEYIKQELKQLFLDIT